MYDVVQRWAISYKGPNLNDILSSDSVRKGKNHVGGKDDHGHGGMSSMNRFAGSASHSKVSGAPWEKLYNLKNATGSSREGPDYIPGAFPGTDTAFDPTGPPAGPQTNYAGSQEQPPYQREPYAQPSYSASSYQQGPGYGTGPPPDPSWNTQGYIAPDELYPPPEHQSAYPSQSNYPAQIQQGYEYGAAPQPPHGFSYDQNAPSPRPPHQQQGYYNSPPQPPGPGYC